MILFLSFLLLNNLGEYEITGSTNRAIDCIIAYDFSHESFLQDSTCLSQNLATLSELIYFGGQETERQRYSACSEDSSHVNIAIVNLILGYDALYHGRRTEAYRYFFDTREVALESGYNQLYKLSLLSLLEFYQLEYNQLNTNYEDHLIDFNHYAQNSIDSAWYLIHDMMLHTKSRESELWYGGSKVDRLEKLIEGRKLNSNMLPYAYSTLGLQYELIENIDRAQYYHELCLESYRATKPFLRFLRNRSLIRLSEIERKRGNFRTALELINNTLKTVDRSDSLQFMLYVDYYRSLNNAGLSQWEKAYNDLRGAFELENSLALNKEAVEVSLIKVRLDVTEKDNELLRQKVRAQEMSSQIAKERLQSSRLSYAAVSLGTLLSFSLIILYGYRRLTSLRRLSLEQEIKDSEQKGQLAAMNAQLDGQEQERKKIASVLHDSISSHLTAASFHLQRIKSGNFYSQHIEGITKASSLIQEAAVRSRNLSHNLYPPLLIKHGLIAALEALCESFSSNKILFSLEDVSENIDLPVEVESKLYYIINELYTNVLKHSEGDLCTTMIYLTNREHLFILVKDNGCGFIVENLGQGLLTIKTRVSSLEGTFSINSSEVDGTEVSLTIPI